MASEILDRVNTCQTATDIHELFESTEFINKLSVSNTDFAKSVEEYINNIIESDQSISSHKMAALYSVFLLSPSNHNTEQKFVWLCEVTAKLGTNHENKYISEIYGRAADLINLTSLPNKKEFVDTFKEKQKEVKWLTVFERAANHVLPAIRLELSTVRRAIFMHNSRTDVGNAAVGANVVNGLTGTSLLLGAFAGLNASISLLTKKNPTKGEKLQAATTMVHSGIALCAFGTLVASKYDVSGGLQLAGSCIKLGADLFRMGSMFYEWSKKPKADDQSFALKALDTKELENVKSYLTDKVSGNTAMSANIQTFVNKINRLDPIDDAYKEQAFSHSEVQALKTLLGKDNTLSNKLLTKKDELKANIKQQALIVFKDIVNTAIDAFRFSPPGQPLRMLTIATSLVQITYPLVKDHLLPKSVSDKIDKSFEHVQKSTMNACKKVMSKFSNMKSRIAAAKNAETLSGNTRDVQTEPQPLTSGLN